MSKYIHTADNTGIKTRLKNAGFTRPQIAEHLGVKLQTVNNWLSGGRPIPADKMRRLLALLEEVSATSAIGQVMAFSVRLMPDEFARLSAATGIVQESEVEGVIRTALEERWGIISGVAKV